MASEAREDESATEFAIRVVKEQGAKDALAELRDRLVNADDALRNHISVVDRSPEDTARINGKAEGVRLAMSFLDEILRAQQ